MLQVLFGDGIGGFDGFFNSRKPSYFPNNTPNNVFGTKDTEDKYIVDIAVPGYKKEWIDISINDDLQLEVVGKIPDGDNDSISQITSLSFHYTIPLPHNVDEEEVEAKLEAGILRIIIKKMKPKEKKIKIK